MFKDNSSGARALRVGPDGRLYASQPARSASCLTVPAATKKWWRKTSMPRTWRSRRKAKSTSPTRRSKTIGYIDGRGKTRVVYSGGEIALPSGVALSPDQAMLVVTDAQARFSWCFQIAADGSLINGEPFYRLEMPESGWMSGVHGCDAGFHRAGLLRQRRSACRCAKRTAARRRS